MHSLFDIAKTPYLFEAHFLHYANNQIDESFPLAKDELKELSINYLRKYCSEVDHFDSNVWFLFYRCKQTERIPPEGNQYRKQEVIPGEAKEIMKSFLDIDLDGFLFAIIDPEPVDQKVFAIANVVPELFNSWEAFKNELDTKDERSSKYLKEFKAFLVKFAASHYAQYIDFNFETIPIQKKLRAE